MINYIILALCVNLLILNPAAAEQGSYTIQPLSEDFYSARAIPGGRSSTNAFFFIAGEEVIAGGAHMSKEAMEDLWSAVAATVHKPIRYFILTHHHFGFAQIDTAFPADVTLILSGETGKNLLREGRIPDSPLLLFSDSLTFKSRKGQALVISSIGVAHSDGDTIVIAPDEKIAYVGDLLYVKSVGYMGDGHMRPWLQSLDFLSELGLKQIIPGYGPPVGKKEVDEFREYFRDFLSAVLSRIEAGESAATIRKTFILPKYQEWSGYKQFLPDNAARAWLDLQDDEEREGEK